LYQPQIGIDGSIIGVEALLRWRRPGRGMESPDEFIPVAEETGLFADIGQWVLQESARQIAAWHKAGVCNSDTLRLAVNVSPRHFRQDDFVDKVLQVFSQADVSPSCLDLEITETLLMGNVDDVIGKMEALREHGIRISIDDFGTGYSSLTYLKQLPFDQLKIDQSFVRDITTDSNDAAIVETIIAMASHLDLGVIAEGVEDERQYNFLVEKGCSSFQGCYFSYPLSAEDFEKFIAESAVVYRSDSAS
jgi:EAL domain-containing protein (putative c-di-GMP-specific phosphodiesterase class I)